MQAFLKGSTAHTADKKPCSSNLCHSKDLQSSQHKHIPWVEKYRPRTVNDVASQQEVIAVLKKTLQGSDLPNLLFYGPPGTGKTSTILAAARSLFGLDRRTLDDVFVVRPELYKDRVMELNASDERGISVVREKVKSFSQFTANTTQLNGKTCPPYKIIILDEADSMTSAAQAALRRIMEKETRTTRFCLICNYVSRIIQPITSRCAKFRFKPLSTAVMVERIMYICREENVTLEDEALDALMRISDGDMRRAVMFLQSASRLCGEESVSKQVVMDITGVIPEQLIDEIFKVCHSDSYDKLDLSVKNIIREGYAGSQLLGQCHDRVIGMEELNDKQKSVICCKMGMVDHCLVGGADEYLQLMALLSIVMQQLCHG